jgi:glycosyltransferase involved in cell wall biosynthesis
MKLSIIIPSHNEAKCIAKTVTELNNALLREKIHHEILIINDNSNDSTESVLLHL